MPLSLRIIWNEAKEEEEDIEEGINEREERKEVIIQSKEAVKLFTEKTEVIEGEEEKGIELLEKKWERLKTFVRNSMIGEEERIKKRTIGYK